MPVNGAPLNVLVIEDNPADAFMLAEHISATPVTISSIVNAATISEAIRLLDEKQYDIIFLDLALPDVKQEDSVDLIRSAAGNTPIIVVSGISDEKMALKTITRGAQDYIYKETLDSGLLAKSIYYSIERARTRQRLTESERRFRYISEHFPNGKVCFLNRDLKYVFETGGHHKNRTPDMHNLIGKKFTDGYVGQNTERIEHKLGRAFEGKEVLFEVRVGREVFLISAVAAYEDGGTAENILVVSQNITQLKQAEEQIHFQTTVLENITDSVIITDLAKNVTFWNKAATAIYGYEELEMIGENLDLLVVDQNDGTDTYNMLRNLNEKGMSNTIVRQRTKNGSIIWVELKLTYNYNVANKITGIIGVSKDITTQRAEEHLLKLFQSVIINSHDAVLITEAIPSSGDLRKIVFVNEAFYDLTGFSPHEVIGNTFFMLVGPSTDKSEIQRIENNLNRWQSFASEVSLYRKDNSSFWVDVMIMPVSDETGNFTHWVYLQRDITADRESAEKLLQKNMELTKTNLELDKFVYSASHDLRAPLTSVLGLVGLMRRELFAGDAKIYLDKIEESVQRLDRLIQNIINYSRNSRLNLKPTGIDFKEIFDTAVSMHKFMDHADMIRFEYENFTDEQFVSDPDRWQIIMNNLVSNGIKFARRNISSFISLKIYKQENELVLKLSDNGIGITHDQLKSVFQMFYRATSSSEGSGLGLYIVQQTIDLLGGTIEVESESMEYTNFIIRVPFEVTTFNSPINVTKSNLTAQ
ncbi:MAG: PAS domain S-box protein [Bacteroidota bacterium]|nr:PAS domain S-box protein [Bacteroidota bacterium]